MAEHAAEGAGDCERPEPPNDQSTREVRQAEDAAATRDVHAGAASGRGRDATTPSQIPRTGWRDILLRTKQEVSDDNVSLVAAGVAFYGLLAVFPGIAALVSIYGLVADPVSAGRLFANMPGLPSEARKILTDQAAHVAAAPTSTLSFSLVAALVLTIYSASRAMSAIITALNISYDESETRGFVRLTLLSFGLTAGLLAFCMIALGVIVGLPAIIDALRLPAWMAMLLHLLPWPVLAACAVGGLALLYRFGPARRPAEWPWLRIGALVATLLWLVGSAAFSFYVANFGSYNETYGSVGALVVLLMWFYLSAYVVIVGAELNSEIEHQTTRDTTIGRDRPMGERDAYVADTVGRIP
ncbi:YihY/virulence factor BrkB family protein [Candidatus Binatia bacterium]|nr:YihY/virulence factor BrkB family protein [Candidatus Binatia bacterium]